MPSAVAEPAQEEVSEISDAQADDRDVDGSVETLSELSEARPKKELQPEQGEAREQDQLENHAARLASAKRGPPAPRRSFARFTTQNGVAQRHIGREGTLPAPTRLRRLRKPRTAGAFSTNSR